MVCKDIRAFGFICTILMTLQFPDYVLKGEFLKVRRPLESLFNMALTAESIPEDIRTHHLHCHGVAHYTLRAHFV